MSVSDRSIAVCSIVPRLAPGISVAPGFRSQLDEGPQCVEYWFGHSFAHKAPTKVHLKLKSFIGLARKLSTYGVHLSLDNPPSAASFSRILVIFSSSVAAVNGLTT